MFQPDAGETAAAVFDFYLSYGGGEISLQYPFSLEVMKAGIV